jgi:hypothetical protein
MKLLILANVSQIVGSSTLNETVLCILTLLCLRLLQWWTPSLRMLFFWNMMMRYRVISSQYFRDIIFLQNCGNWLPNAAVSYPRRMEASNTLLWKPQIAHHIKITGLWNVRLCLWYMGANIAGKSAVSIIRVEEYLDHGDIRYKQYLDTCRPTTRHCNSTLQGHWGLNSDCCPRWKSFKFIPVNAFVTLQCTKTSIVWRIKGLYSAPTPALKG